MGVDLRQVVAGILTLTMFVMLGNMIKRDHFDSVAEKFPGDRSVLDNAKNLKQGLVTLAEPGRGPWRADVEELKPCWSRELLDDVEDTDGYVIFSLTNGPEYYVSQIADAVVVARYLGATLVLPDIRGSNPGDERIELYLQIKSQSSWIQRVQNWKKLLISMCVLRVVYLFLQSLAYLCKCGW